MVAIRIPGSRPYSLPLVLAVSLAGFALISSAALALTSTTTHGRVCDDEPCHIETFSGGYVFKGRTRPSQRGQVVRFAFKRVGANKWHRFGRPGNTRKAFISPDGSPFDRINRHHTWREHFDINGFAGSPHRHWKLRARFIRQDGYRSSFEIVRVDAFYGD